ncbi:hypothetical protein LAZ67_2001282 [Cordylochernes scorpioides]|uniref:Retrovirus-related Pol polyprotein from transposon TNT 1-94 n=1 Tax=Cordylochernes scorpioides TaxID=51811 RepID=A0ABY6K168_9ARAC|nr:hypothetical protein LAZ67_2001282 [Cordylochernes scorpioides]
MSSLYQIEKLISENYETWKMQMKMILIHSELWDYANSIRIKPETEVESAEWEKKDQKALATIVLSLSPSEIIHVKRCKTSAEAWKLLNEVHQPKGPATKVFLTKQLILLKMKPNERMQDYLNKFSSLADKLSEMDAQVPEDFLSILLLCSLPESYEGFRTAIETRDKLPSFETLKVKMLEEEIRQTELNGTTYSEEKVFLGNSERKPFSSTSKPKAKGFPFNCHFCGKKGHKAADCRKGKFKSPRTEMVASLGIECLNKLDANEWCLDSGATAHMCSTRNSFTHFEDTAPVKITLADGQFIEAIGKGNVKLDCQSNTGTVTLSLEDVLFVPRLNGNLFSIRFRIFKNYAEKQTGKRLKCIRNDNAPEYLSKEFKDYLEGEGIGRQLSVEYTPQQNGVAERANRTLVDMTRCFMIEEKDSFKEIPLAEERGSTSEIDPKADIESQLDLEVSEVLNEPSESGVIISRRGRPRYIRTGKPGRPRKEYPTANLSTQEFSEVKYSPDPKDAEEALSGKDSYFWRKAMREEFDSLIENKTWELVDPPKGQNVIGSKWVFKRKYSSDGSLERHKARLVAKGFSQQYGIDYEETFAPVVRQSTIRVFFALAVEYNLIVHQMDVQSAYLNGEIKEEVYMAQPENFVSRKYPEKFWHEKLDTELKYLGLKQIQSDNCVYIKHHEGILLVAIYVDDLIIAAEREDTLISFKESMKKIFKIKDLGKINYCLGIRIQTEKDGSISIDQEKYIEELLAKYRMKEAKPISTPMDSNSKLTKISSIEGENEPVKKVEYQSLIGSLIYLSVSTRPDISYAVSALGQFSNDPRRQHWNAAKRVLRYLKGTLGLKITYEKTNETLYGYVDADWGGPIAWESKKQQTVALSSTESEYIALCEAGKEAVYLRALLHEMGFGELLNEPTVLKTDDQGAQQLARNPVHHARTKHIDIKWHYIRSICSDGLIEVVHTPTQENVADILTKGLPRVLKKKKNAQEPLVTLAQLHQENDEALQPFRDSMTSSGPGTLMQLYAAMANFVRLRSGQINALLAEVESLSGILESFKELDEDANKPQTDCHSTQTSPAPCLKETSSQTDPTKPATPAPTKRKHPEAPYPPAKRTNLKGPAKPAPSRVPKPAAAQVVLHGEKSAAHTVVVSDDPQADPREIYKAVRAAHTLPQGVWASLRTKGKLVLHSSNPDIIPEVTTSLASKLTGMKVRQQKVILPRICLFKVDEATSNSTIEETLLGTPAVSQLPGDKVVRVAHRSAPRNGTCTAFIEVDLNTFRALGNRGRIVVDGVILNFEESIRARICFRCCGFGHNSAQCTRDPKCFHCGEGGHEGRFCPSAADRHTSKCTNCCAKGLADKHEARASSCPTLKLRALKF